MGRTADGYTLLFVASPFTTVAAAAKNLATIRCASCPWRPSRSDRSRSSTRGQVDVPANTMREFVAPPRTMPGKLNYGSAGAGSVNHLALELLAQRAPASWSCTPYRGIADATKDLLGGSIQSMTASIPAAPASAADKKVKVLAVTGPKQHSADAGRAELAEEGVANASVINYGASSRRRARRARWSPAPTPRCRRCLAQPEVRERLEREGAEIVSGSPEQLGAIIEVTSTTGRS